MKNECVERKGKIEEHIVRLDESDEVLGKKDVKRQRIKPMHVVVYVHEGGKDGFQGWKDVERCRKCCWYKLSYISCSSPCDFNLFGLLFLIPFCTLHNPEKE